MDGAAWQGRVLTLGCSAGARRVAPWGQVWTLGEWVGLGLGLI
jgi:hypothetical protein